MALVSATPPLTGGLQGATEPAGGQRERALAAALEHLLRVEMRALAVWAAHGMQDQQLTLVVPAVQFAPMPDASLKSSVSGKPGRRPVEPARSGAGSAGRCKADQAGSPSGRHGGQAVQRATQHHEHQPRMVRQRCWRPARPAPCRAGNRQASAPPPSQRNAPRRSSGHGILQHRITSSGIPGWHQPQCERLHSAGSAFDLLARVVAQVLAQAPGCDSVRASSWRPSVCGKAFGPLHALEQRHRARASRRCGPASPAGMGHGPSAGPSACTA
jgi:hypothetical protein